MNDMLQKELRGLRRGDRVTIAGHRVGTLPRTGEVIEVLREPGHERCRVLWDDGNETLVYQGAGLAFERAAAERREIE